MKNKLLFVVLTGFFLLAMTGGAAYAVPITVSQGGTYLGTIDAYTGTLSGAANYAYSSSKNHVVNGPSPVEYQGQFFFYEGSDGLSFNMIFSSIGSSALSDADMDITVAGSTTDPGVLVSDDANELRETATNDFFTARLHYYQYLGDGGVIGEIGGNAWSINVDSIFYSSNIASLMAYDEDGSSISLSLDLNQDIVFSASAVPEPATMLLLGSGLMGLAGFRRKFKKQN